MKVFQLSTATEWQPKVAHGETVGFIVKTSHARNGGKKCLQVSFLSPVRGLNIFSAIQPTVSPWAAFGARLRRFGRNDFIFCRRCDGASNEWSVRCGDSRPPACQQLLEQGPVTNFVQTGVLNIHADKESVPNSPPNSNLGEWDRLAGGL